MKTILFGGIALFGYSSAALLNNANSRRGLAVDGSYMVSVEGPEGSIQSICDDIEAEIPKIKSQFGAERGGELRNLPINAVCFVHFTGSQAVLQGVHNYVDSLTIPDGITIDFEQDHWVDTLQIGSWGIDRVDQTDLPLDNSYTVAGGLTGQGVSVYVIDTGINQNHVDFGNRATALDNFSRETPADANGHGTHCAGTVGGTQYGVAKQATLFGIKVLGTNGGRNSDVIAGVNRAVAHANGKVGVLSMSLGGGRSNQMNQAVQNAATNMMVIVAAGNDSSDACGVSPASATGNVVTVGSTTINDRMSSFSNWGTCTDIYAPGSQIKSAWIGSTTATRTISGTSMATPHVAGAAALLLQKHGTTLAGMNLALAELKAGVQNKITQLAGTSPNNLLQVPKPPVPAPAPNPAPGNPNPAPAPTPTPPGQGDLSQWTCPDAWFNANDGCDCGCGLPIDPDCRIPGQTRLYCRGRGARWWQVCSEATNTCVNRYELYNADEKDPTLPPTFENRPDDREGVENGVELPPILNDVDGPSVDGPSGGGDNTDPEESGVPTAAIIGGVAGAVGVAGVAFLVKKQRDNSQGQTQQQSNEISPQQGMPYANAANPQYGAYPSY